MSSQSNQQSAAAAADDDRTAQINQQIMQAFAERTGLAPAAARVSIRYLWTDAFAVCNFLELLRNSGENRYLQQALDLVDQVHHVLGRHRADDTRQGWISGLAEAEGERHPTRGGLRIGKRLPERRREELFDGRMEWDRDGQYYHYLTKWMHALECVARVSGDPKHIRWAQELAKSAHAAFVYEPRPGERKRMVWKMSTDLRSVLVPSMGHHDPLDGLITYQQIQAAARDLGLPPDECELAGEIADMVAMCEGVSWQTDDTLGVGGLLIDSCRLAKLIAGARLPESDRLEFVLDEAERSLDALERVSQLGGPAKHRLAFRELGLSIGLHAIDHLRSALQRHPERFPNRRAIDGKLSKFARFQAWGEAIESFWLDPDNQQSASWLAHQDINSVMLATSLAPDGFLAL